MNLFPDQVSALGAAGVRQLDVQLQLQMQLFGNAASRAFDGAEQFAALQFATTRSALDTSADLLRQIVVARDPRDLFALTKQARVSFDNMLDYQRRLFGIVSAAAMSGAVGSMPHAVTPTASAALQKLAALPAVSDMNHLADVVDFVEVAAVAADIAAVAEPAPEPEPELAPPALNAVAAATDHHDARPTAAPLTQGEAEADPAPPATSGKSGGRQRKK